MKQKRKYFIRAILLAFLIGILFFVIRGFYYYNQYKPHLLLKENGENALLMSSGEKVVLWGLVGSVDLSENEASVIYLRKVGGFGKDKEVVEMDLETQDVEVLVTADELRTVTRSIRAKKGLAYEETEERIRSVKYVPDTDAISFIWENSLYMMDLDSKEVTRIWKKIRDIEAVNVTEGREYKWLDARNVVLWIRKEDRVTVYQYDILERDKRFILHGNDVSANGNVLVSYQASGTISDFWITNHNFYFFDLESRKQTREYVYTFHGIMRGAEEVVFEQYEDGVLIWGEENQNYYYIYDSKRDVAVRIWLPGKKIAAIL